MRKGTSAMEGIISVHTNRYRLTANINQLTINKKLDKNSFINITTF